MKRLPPLMKPPPPSGLRSDNLPTGSSIYLELPWQEYKFHILFELHTIDPMLSNKEPHSEAQIISFKVSDSSSRWLLFIQPHVVFTSSSLLTLNFSLPRFSTHIYIETALLLQCYTILAAPRYTFAVNHDATSRSPLTMSPSGARAISAITYLSQR